MPIEYEDGLPVVGQQILGREEDAEANNLNGAGAGEGLLDDEDEANNCLKRIKTDWSRTLDDLLII